MYKPTDYPRTLEQHEADERERARVERDLDARMEMFDRGRVSFRAAHRGGDEYEIEMRESAAVDELVAAPVAAALNGWMRAVRGAGRAA